MALRRPRATGPPGGSALARDLAIDLGTANTLVYARGRGIVVDEPSVLALDTGTGEVLALGDEASQMVGRTPGRIQAVRPLRQGAVTDPEITERLLRLLLHRAGASRVHRPIVLLCVPSSITEVERRAVTDAARRAGAAGTRLLEQPLAAALGAGLRISEPLGTMVLDIGGGTTEAAVLSLGGVVARRALRVGSFDIDAAIQAFVKREHGIAIGEPTAEDIKLAIGSAWPGDDEVRAEVRGRDLVSGLPKTVVLTSEEVRAALEEPLVQIIDAIKETLDRTPPELASDIMDRGIMLAGGGSLLQGLDERLREETQMPAHRAESPLTCVAVGSGRSLEEFEAIHRSNRNHRNHRRTRR